MRTMPNTRAKQSSEPPPKATRKRQLISERAGSCAIVTVGSAGIATL
jgi:hypothetical protein